MKKILLVVIFTLCASSLFAQYAEVTIKEINFQTDEALLTAGANNTEPIPALSISGDTVIVSGIVMCPSYLGANPDSSTTLRAGAPAIYLQDPNDRNWSGILVRDEEGSDAFSILDTGLSVKFKAVVFEYFTTTQLNAIDFQASNILGVETRPQPVVLTLDSLFEKGTTNPNYLAEKWEGVYVEFQNLTAFEPNAVGSGTFKIVDENNTQMVVYNKGSFFRYSFTAPQPGTKIERIRGYIETRTSEQYGWFMINPVYEDDIVYGDVFPPNISDVVRDIAEVKFDDEVNISAKILDIDGSVASAQVVYDVDNIPQLPIDMTMTNDSIWSGTIPALNDSVLISYFVKAFDNDGNVSYSPADTVGGRYFYLVLNRALTIRDVQFSPFGSGFSGYHNYTVTVKGRVSADTSDIPGDGGSGAKVYIQDGVADWSGIQIFGTASEGLKRGDLVEATGIVNEQFGVTRIGNLDKGVEITMRPADGLFVEPTEIATAVIGTSSGGELPAEAMESVLLKYTNVTVIDENADGNNGPDEGSGGSRNHGEILIADGSAVGTRVELQDGGNNYHNFWDAAFESEPIRVLDGSTFDELIGVLYYSFGNFKLVPRKNDDFVGYTDIDESIITPKVFSLSQNYPNPFNPTTIISYSIPEVSNVKLKIYDMLGREIKTLVNKEQSAGIYDVEFNAATLSSGVYFYRIVADSYGATGSFVDSKKLLLLK
ncbi:MAG: T9SS type A sorting domain-containing protein [Melioribacteraceae bacterium]|nr:T9SS type A sorting domain-containing protein [Melioribacteraceae bacterium]